MGHERVGALPHSRRWRDIVAQMESYSGSAEEVADLAASTLKNVRSRYQRLHVDEGVISAFQFLIALAKCASEGSRQSSSLFPTIDHDENPTPLRLVAELRTWVDAHQDSQEYAEIAKKASADAIMLWSDKHKMQPTLFSEEQDSKYVWQRADNGSGFCEVTSLFFSKFTERYLNYFLEREASAVIFCNGASDSLDISSSESKTFKLNYLNENPELKNVTIGLDKTVQNVFRLPDRVQDLVELAGYVYCADRLVGRGARNSVEYHSWARSFHFVVRVRDHDFWQQSSVSESLANALKFMTGDREYRFEFQPGHSTNPTSLFDTEEFHGVQLVKPTVVLFSGGLDSLAGTIELLETTQDRVYLVSHQSQPGTMKTQNRLAMALKDKYPGRVIHRTFRCSLSGRPRREESQRTRAFLYTSVAFAYAQASEQDRFFMFENGITSINFARREDLANARASRTTHPKTIYLLQEFFSLFFDRPMQIQTPFLWKTKTDVVVDLLTGPHKELLPSAVSCSKTFGDLGDQSHCGGCSQCIDRRFAAYAAGAHEWDKANIYAIDIISHTIPKESPEIRTTAVDYVRQARDFGRWNIDHFYKELVSELSDLAGSFCYLPDCTNEIQAVEKVYCLCRRHGEQVEKAMNRMRQQHEDLYQKPADNSLLQLISDREYLNNPVERMVNSLMEIIRVAIPRMFSTTPPSNEADLNDKLGALLESHRSELRSEHPVISFAGGRTVPDHGSEKKDILIESKFIRSNTTPSKASEGIAADLTKYPSESHILFVVYDPQRRIMNDDQFRGDFESQGGCTVLIIR